MFESIHNEVHFYDVDTISKIIQEIVLANRDNIDWVPQLTLDVKECLWLYRKYSPYFILEKLDWLKYSIKE